MPFAMASEPRYPEIRVQIQSKNPFALVAAVREALRLAHIEQAEIKKFSDEAFSSDSTSRLRRVCDAWVRVESKELS